MTTAGARRGKDMDRWLGDGGMPLLPAVGAGIARYGVEDDGTSWAEADWSPTPLSANPHGVVQGGVQTVLLDAVMNFALNAGFAGRDRTRGTLELKTEYLRAATTDMRLVVRGTAVRVAKQVAWAEGRLLAEDGTLLSRATGTWLLHREPPKDAPPAS